MFFLALLAPGCAPSDPRNVDDAAPISPLAGDYQDRIKADLSRTLADPAGAIYTSRSEKRMRPGATPGQSPS